MNLLVAGEAELVGPKIEAHGGGCGGVEWWWFVCA